MGSQLPSLTCTISDEVLLESEAELEQVQVELCCQGGQELLGLSSDLVKAFNNLPRAPLRHVALHLGFPMTLVRPWFAFLAGVQRRFNVRHCVSRPLLSTSGFPERSALWPWLWLTGLIMLTCMCSLRRSAP